MRLALAALALLAAAVPAAASEDNVCKKGRKPYPVSFDRFKETFSIDKKPAAIEHISIASAVAEIRGTIDSGSTFFWAELNGDPSIEYMDNQKIIRIDPCEYVDKPIK